MSYLNSITARMQRARTPFGAVPISTIYGYDYPLADSTTATSARTESKKQVRHNEVSESVDYMMRSSRAFSADPFFEEATAGLSFVPHALREARSRSPSPYSYDYRATTPMRVAATIPSSSRYVAPDPLAVDHHQQQSTTIAYGGNTPWNSTGFYYTPRYPQSYRGTASTTNLPYSRRYPARRFVPSYVPMRYNRKLY